MTAARHDRSLTAAGREPSARFEMCRNALPQGRFDMGLLSDVMSFGPTRRAAAQNIAEVSTSSAPMLKRFRTYLG